MSATNHTTTIELSQYISTDKPTYLTDYNGDMLKIDNAFAADRDSISTAQNKANTADGKADANKLSIDTLDAQINGDPTDPSDTGLAGKVTGIDGEVDTIEALIGNGTPTTSNQTIIGAINGLEGAIAPREDGADLANSYSVGEQFARGGSVYTALTSLTAGAAFASLTLNTDYKNSDTLVEQIADVASDVTNVASALSASKAQYVTVDALTLTKTADGVKTASELLAELLSDFIAACQALPDAQFYRPLIVVDGEFGIFTAENTSARYDNTMTSASRVGTFNNNYVSATHVYTGSIDMKAAPDAPTECHAAWEFGVSTDWTLTNRGTLVPTNGTVFTMISDLYKYV